MCVVIRPKDEQGIFFVVAMIKLSETQATPVFYDEWAFDKLCRGWRCRSWTESDTEIRETWTESGCHA
jgi:hypothetical protein